MENRVGNFVNFFFFLDVVVVVVAVWFFFNDLVTLTGMLIITDFSQSLSSW